LLAVRKGKIPLANRTDLDLVHGARQLNQTDLAELIGAISDAGTPVKKPGTLKPEISKLPQDHTPSSPASNATASTKTASIEI
jgi:hypothetical protein